MTVGEERHINTSDKFIWALWQTGKTAIQEKEVHITVVPELHLEGWRIDEFIWVRSEKPGQAVWGYWSEPEEQTNCEMCERNLQTVKSLCSGFLPSGCPYMHAHSGWILSLRLIQEVGTTLSFSELEFILLQVGDYTLCLLSLFWAIVNSRLTLCFNIVLYTYYFSSNSLNIF